MTDKQIIIHGVDVSGCEYLIKESVYDYYNGEYLTLVGQCTCSDNEMCKYNPQCSYKKVLKQLKAKEQECDMWKNLTIDNGAVALKYQQQIDQLKAEVKSKTEYIQEQRDIINQYSKEIEMYKKCQGKRASKREEELKTENKELKKTVDDLLHKPEIQDKILWKIDNEALLGSKDAWIYKLEKTLTEIKEIAETATKCLYVTKSDDYTDGYRWLGSIILQKISEVEDENNG